MGPHDHHHWNNGTGSNFGYFFFLVFRLEIVGHRKLRLNSILFTILALEMPVCPLIHVRLTMLAFIFIVHED